MRQSLMLIGRSGSGKTSVMETLCGSEVEDTRYVQSIARFELEVNAKETLGFFSGEHDMQACTQDLEDCVRFFSGIHVIGFVIRIGRFTPEEKAMMDIFLDVLGEGACNFTIVIFTHLDNLIYDDVLLSEFLQDSPQELQDLISLCDGRYVGFDNTGSTVEKQGYTRSLIEAMKALHKKNKSAKYTVELLEQAREAKLMKDQEKRKVEEENFRLLKEQMKHDIRTEVEAKISQELEDGRIAQDNPTRRFAEYYKESQQACGDHRIEKLEDNYDSEDNQGRNNTDGMRYSEDQARRRPEERCFPENQKQKPKTKPKPVHLKKRGHEKNKRLAVWVCTKCYEPNSNDVKTCKCGEDKRDTTKRVSGLPGDANTVPKETNPEGKLKKTPKKTSEASAEKTPEVLAQGASAGKNIATIRPTIRYGVDDRELRVVLIGKTGVGKSSTANTILGKTIFKAKASPKSVTEKSHCRRIERFGKKILLVDTPGLLDTSTPKDVIENEIKKCIGISAPGPHAFILVMSFTNRFTEEEKNVLNEVGDMFGDQMINYLVVLFTGRDQIDKGSTEHHIDEYPKEFRSLVQKAGGGYITFNNRGSLSEKEDDAQELLNRIDEMVKKNGGGHFTSEMFEAAEEVIQKRIANELAEKKEEIRKAVEEEIRKAVEEEMRGKYDAEITRLKGLREKDLVHYEVLKRELKKEQMESRKNTLHGNLKGALRPLVIDEMKANAEKKLIHQIQTCEGPEKAEAHRQLAGAGQEIQELLQKTRRKRPEEEVSQNDDFEENASRATEKYLVDLRDEQRGNIESEKGVLQKIKEKLSGIMSPFFGLFQ